MTSGPSPSIPATRFARLSHADPELLGVTITFLAAGANDAPDSSNHGILAKVAAADPERAKKIQAGLAQLIARDDAVMSWLESDPAHAAQFARDPVSALRAALPDLPEDFFDGWSGTQ